METEKVERDGSFCIAGLILSFALSLILTSVIFMIRGWYYPPQYTSLSGVFIIGTFIGLSFHSPNFYHGHDRLCSFMANLSCALLGWLALWIGFVISYRIIF